jgi:hypothetical protein
MVALNGVRLGPPGAPPTAPDARKEEQRTGVIKGEPCGHRPAAAVVVLAEARHGHQAAKLRAQVGLPVAAFAPFLMVSDEIASFRPLSIQAAFDAVGAPAAGTQARRREEAQATYGTMWLDRHKTEQPHPLGSKTRMRGYPRYGMTTVVR